MKSVKSMELASKAKHQIVFSKFWYVEADQLLLKKIDLQTKFLEIITNNKIIFLQQNSEGTITFKIVPADSKGGIRESKVLS